MDMHDRIDRLERMGTRMLEYQIRQWKHEQRSHRRAAAEARQLPASVPDARSVDHMERGEERTATPAPPAGLFRDLRDEEDGDNCIERCPLTTFDLS